MLTILCWHHPHTRARGSHLVVSKISTHLCRSRPKLIWSDQIRKPQLLPLTAVLKLSVFFFVFFFCFFFLFLFFCFLKILKFSSHFFRVWRHPPTQFTPNVRPAPFPVWEFIMTDDDCNILFERTCEDTVWLRHLNQETPSSSKPNQTKK